MPTAKELVERGELVASWSYKVSKSNELVQKSRYNLSLSQQKLLSYIISMIQPFEKDENGHEIIPSEYPLDYEFDIPKYARILGVDDKNGYFYKAVKDDITAILNCTVWVYDETLEREKTVRWLDIAEMAPRSGHVKVRLHYTITPYLYNLKSRFTSYELCEIFPFRSRYSIRMYELCLSHLYEHHFRISVSDLKRYFMVDRDDIYKEYKEFNRRIIRKSVEEVNRYTNIRILVESSGRPVKEVIISVKDRRKDR